MRRVRAFLRRAATRVLGRDLPPLDRQLVAETFLRGTGIEIGALSSPQKVPKRARVTYVDRLPPEASAKFEDLKGVPLNRVDVIDDAESLRSFGDGSQDFVIANHVLEHLQDPIAGLLAMLRVTKAGGVVLLSVPDKRFTFDADRPVTPYEHLLRDHREGPAWSARQHFEDWSRLVNKREESRVDEEVRHLMNIGWSIHFHVWTWVEVLDLVRHGRDEAAFDLEVALKNRDEVVLVLRKLA